MGYPEKQTYFMLIAGVSEFKYVLNRFAVPEGDCGRTQISSSRSIFFFLFSLKSEEPNKGLLLKMAPFLFQSKL